MSNNYFVFKQFAILQDRCTFKVGTDGVLLGAYADVKNAMRILDIGTGTGLIAIMLAQRSEAWITGIEPDFSSFLQAKENSGKSPWSDRVSIINSRLQDYAPENVKFDLIVSNPPYFSNSLKNPDPGRASVRHNDDLGPADLLEGARRLLSDSGTLQVILPYAEGNIFIAEASGYDLFCNDILKIKPLPSSGIARLILSFSKQKLKVSEKFLTISNIGRHSYTDEYKDLTKDFYLKF